MRHRKGTGRSVLFLIGCLASPASAAPTHSANPSPPSTPSGPATVPATAPATRPATTRPAQAALPADASTPKDALKLFAAAMRDGDAEKLRAVVLASDAAEGRMLGAMADLAAALARLSRSAVKAFGEQEASRFTDDTAAHFAETLARIDSAEVAVEGDKATVRYADAKDAPFELRKVGGQWKVPMAEFSKGADPAALDQRLAELNVQKKTVNDLADEIAAGKYKSADSALEAWRAKIMQALPTRPPATGPAAPGAPSAAPSGPTTRPVG